MARDMLEELLICSSPYESDDWLLVDGIVSERARGYATAFLRRYRVELESASAGLIPLLERWIDSDIAFDTAWDPCLALVRSSLLGAHADPLHAAALLGLRVSAAGVPGAWSLKLLEQGELYLDHLVLPVSSAIQVRGSEGALEVRLQASEGQPVEARLISEAGVWRSSHGLELARCRMAEHEAHLAAGRPLRDARRYLGDAVEMSAAPPAKTLALCDEALGVLRAHAPEYLRWVDKVLRRIIVLDGSDQVLRSASSEHLPATIAASFPAAPVAMAEMMVHECSHQYFNIASRVEDVCDHSDPARYYSPIKGAERPLEMVMLAFHAFANVVLFYRACADSGFADREHCLASIDRHLPELEVLCGHLRSSRSITRVGRTLWEPLAARVFEARSTG